MDGIRANDLIAVREGDERDLPFIVDLGRRVAMTSVSALRDASPPMVENSYERLVEYVESRERTIFIAERDGREAGFLMLLEDLPEEVTLEAQGFIAYMAVEPEERRHGAGAALLAAAEDYSRERGLPTISLMVTEDNVPARRLYDAAGYVTERRLMTKRLEP